MDEKRLKNKNQMAEKQGVHSIEHASKLAVINRKVQLEAATTATAPRNLVKMTDRSDSPLATADDGHKCRLFVGNLPKIKTKQEIFDEVSRITHGRLVRVIIHKNFDNPSMNRGSCFLDYGSAVAAEDAKRTLSQHKLFGYKTTVDWANPKPQPDVDTMPKVRVIFVRQYGGVLDERVLARKFGRYGAVERVKKLKNYAFVHFHRHEDAQSAMYALDGSQDVATGVRFNVAWAKSPADKQMRQRMLPNRERRFRKSVPQPPACVVTGANGRAATNAAAAPATTPITTITVTTSDRDNRANDVPCMPLQRPLPSSKPCPTSGTAKVHAGAATTAARVQTNAKRSRRRLLDKGLHD